MKEIKLPIYSLVDEVRKEREQSYLKQLKKLFPNAKPLTEDYYLNIKWELENNNNKDVLSNLMEKSIYYILDSIANIYAKYDIEEVLPLDEGLSTVLYEFNEKLNRFETLPPYIAEYTHSIINYYVYLILARKFNMEYASKLDLELVEPKDLQAIIDSTETDISAEEVSKKLWFEQQIKKASVKLTDREKEVLIKRFGLIDGRERTFQQLADDCGLTRGRVEKLLKSALTKLRSNKHTTELEDYNNKDMGI